VRPRGPINSIGHDADTKVRTNQTKSGPNLPNRVPNEEAGADKASLYNFMIYFDVACVSILFNDYCLGVSDDLMHPHAS
jgi:hypothetical protein